MTVRSERSQGLGRGLASLIPQRSAGQPGTLEIPTSRIKPNPHQPRKRFDRFEIQEGHIVPAEGAALIEDEPWRGFDKNLGKYRSVEQPYLPFLRLSRRIHLPLRHWT